VLFAAMHLGDLPRAIKSHVLAKETWDTWRKRLQQSEQEVPRLITFSLKNCACGLSSPKSGSKKPSWRPGGPLRNGSSYLRKRRLASCLSARNSLRHADFHRRHGCRSQAGSTRFCNRWPDRPVGGWEVRSPEARVAPLFALPSFTPEFLCSSHPSLDALGVCEKSEGKESLRRLASNTRNA